MKNIRVISKLDIKGPNLVKGIHLEGLRVLGKPYQFAQYYYEQNIDEIIYYDTVASLYNRNSLFDIIKETSQNIFIPITAGGGIRSLKDIENILRAGADKVSINTQFIKTPDFIKEASKRFGSSTIISDIQCIKRTNNFYEVLIDNGREKTGINVFDWSKKVEKLGAGEILLTDIKQEGTGRGCDIELVKKISTSVSIPVIYCGGIGKLEHIKEVIIDGRADAVALASILHYDAINKIEFNKEEYKKEGNLIYLTSGKSFSKVEPSSVIEIKKYLRENKINVR